MPNPHPSVATPIECAALRLVAFAREMLQRISGARACADTRYLPKRFVKDPERAQRRVARATEWAEALVKTVLGSAIYLLPERPRKIAVRPAIGVPMQPRRVLTTWQAEQQRLAARRRTIRRAFATRPTSLIARRLARRMGVAENTDSWPTDLLGITQTPAELCRAVRAEQSPERLEILRRSEAEARAAIRRQALHPYVPPPPAPAPRYWPLLPSTPAFSPSG